VLYNFILHSKKVTTKEYLADKLSFACRRSTGIQIADLIARETMKHLDRELSGTALPSRISFAELRNSRRFLFRSFGKLEFEAQKTTLGDDFRHKATLTEYRKWLAENGLQDCQTNRIEHLKSFPEVWDKAAKPRSD